MNHPLNRMLLAAVLGALPFTAFAGGADDVSASEVRVRAVPEGQPNTAAFMTLTNTGDTDHAVVSAASDAANIVELHTHVNEGGMMKMRRIERIDVAASATTVLEPGGLHVMLIDLKRQLAEGEEVAVTLVFEDGSELALSAPVQKVMTMMGHGHGGQGSMQGSTASD